MLSLCRLIGEESEVFPSFIQSTMSRFVFVGRLSGIMSADLFRLGYSRRVSNFRCLESLGVQYNPIISLRRAMSTIRAC